MCATSATFGSPIHLCFHGISFGFRILRSFSPHQLNSLKYCRDQKS